MNNPLRIPTTFDKHLTKPTELTVFGRAALALGYPGGAAVFGATRDVDVIIPLEWLETHEQDMDFWDAQQRTNAELEPDELYLTHLFRETAIILTPDWIARRMRIPLGLRQLVIFRPDTLDLMLTKMGRGDENDLADTRFLLQQEPVSAEKLHAAFHRARLPDVPEIQEIFQATKPKVLAILESLKKS